MCPILSWNIGVSYFTAVVAIYERNQINLYMGVCEKNMM